MKILVVSDSHGKTDNFLLLKKKISKPDLIIHCGDGTEDFDFISDFFKCKVCGVSGNCDFFTREPKSINLNIEGKIIHIEHGNQLPVFSKNDLFLYAKNSGFDVILYGHTHIQNFIHLENIFVVNPGSISKPRDGEPSYCIIDTDGKGNYNFSLNRL